VEKRSYKAIAVTAACCAALFANSGRACTVPVFRYALEQWAPDCYQIVVYYDGALSEDDRATIDWLKARISDDKFPANLKVRIVDVSAAPAEAAPPPAKLPAIVVCYPMKGKNAPVVWSGPLNDNTARILVASPARRKVAERILGGDSAVWVLVESGDREKDDAAAAALQTQLEKLEKSLQAPQVSDDDMIAYGIAQTQSNIPMKVSFSLVRVSRADPDEEIFVQMLLRSESDLHEYADQPMAFPIFGRGRILYALVGRGINKANVEDTCGFIANPCSCLVKAQNPGIDLLMAADWDGAIKGELTVVEALPPLTGVMPFPAEQASAEPAAPLEPPIDAAERTLESSTLLRTAAIGGAAIIALVAAGSVFIVRSGKKRMDPDRGNR